MHHTYKVLAFVAVIPFAVIVTLEVFQRELVAGGVSGDTFSNMRNVLYALTLLLLGLSMLSYYAYKTPRKLLKKGKRK